uniref:PH domain-containing protein n=1 Tax=Clytia hemisphaerica TaxID=252671 RepID=A0A7M5UY46_9CNID
MNDLSKLSELREQALSDTSDESELRTPEPDTPLESYFLLNPSDMDNYLHYKAVNHEKLTDWDPTTVLKELYGKITQGSRTVTRLPSKSKKVTCMQGYLDKLPMNQTKVRTFKGWKRRFFQIARGKLYYYEDHKSETPLGNIDILGSEVVAGENNTVNISARMNGDKLVIRCGGESERDDWLTNLQRMSVIDTPIPGSLVKEGPTALLAREGSLKKKKNNKDGTVIIDLGATTIRAGLSSDDVPVVSFPAAFAIKKAEQQRTGRRFTESGLPDPHTCRCGFEAFYPEIRKDAKIIYPLKPSMKIDKYSIKVRYVPGFLEKVFRDLELDSKDRVVVISHSRHLSNRDKEILLDYLFGQMNVRAVYMQQQALLSLYSYSVTSGLIVDIGDHIDILPVIDGSVIEKGVMCLPYGGQQVTEYLGKLLTESGYRLFTDIESYVVRYVKEQVAQVSLDFQEDMASSPKAIEVDIEKFKLPDDRKMIKVGNIKYRCTEGLFNTGLYGKDDLPLHVMVERAIKACEIDHRRMFCKNVYLAGGTSLINGLSSRLEEEIRTAFPDTVQVKVTGGEDRLNAAYKGAIVMTGLSNFQELLINKEEWSNDQSEGLFKRWST